MGIGSNLAGISFGGLSSGIDTQSITDRLLQLEAIPAQRLQRQAQAMQQRRSVLDQLKSQVQALSSAATTLNTAGTFNPVKATSSKTEVATITADSTALAGNYNLSVSKLAQAQKISSTAQANTNDPLGLTGKLVVNGKGITIDASDSLRAIAQKINGTGSGATASVIDGGTGQAFLTLTSNQTGATNKIQIGDLDGNVASALGLANGALAYREPITGGATSAAVASNSTNLGTMMGLTGLGTQSFTLNGTAISVNLDSTNLQGLANAINTSGSGAVATVRSVSQNGSTVYKLDISGLTSNGDADGVLQGLGVLQAGYGNPLIAAQDAQYSVDGVNMTSASNTVTSVIPGATLTLLKANETTPETSTLSLTRDDSKIKDSVKEFMNAYNAMVDFVKNNSQFDKDTFQTGALFGDPVARSVEASISNLVFNNIDGAGQYKNLAAIGFGFDKDGKLELNETTLDNAIRDNNADVARLFRSTGVSTNSQLSFVLGSSKTKQSSGAGYAVNITTAASQHQFTGEAAQTGPLTSQEALTFNGALLGNSNYLVILDAGMTQSQIVDKINNDSKLKDLVSATLDAGKLVITSKRFGSGQQFTVTTDKGTTGSGLGTAVATKTGTDVAGTINGEAATGAGQVLTGNSNNANTDGFQVLYSGSATGAIGSVTFSKGVAPRMADLVNGFTDTVNGLFKSSDDSLNSSIETINDSITAINERIERKRQELTLRFARMEESISKLQSQQARFNQTMGQAR
jgi:flagellar hook-associated protein 2